jgi:hypothetical protein
VVVLTLEKPQEDNVLKILLSQLVLTLLVLGFTRLAHAQSFELGLAEVSGSGCPAGTAASVVSPDGNEVSILFDKFSIELAAGQRVSTVSCQIRIPVTNITPGYQVAAATFDYRGFAQLPQGTTASLRSYRVDLAPLRGGRGGGIMRGILGRALLRQSDVLSSGDFMVTQSAMQSLPRNRRCSEQALDVIVVNVDLTVQQVMNQRQQRIAILQERRQGRGFGRILRERMEQIRAQGQAQVQVTDPAVVTLDTADLGDDSGMKIGVNLVPCRL